jgi:hypothetical protein
LYRAPHHVRVYDGGKEIRKARTISEIEIFLDGLSDLSGLSVRFIEHSIWHYIAADVFLEKYV